MGKAVEGDVVKRARKNTSDLSIPPKPKFEFSKLLMIVTGVFNISVIIFSMVLMWRTGDTSPLAYLIPSVSGECGVVAGMYLNKAKVENRVKLMRIYGIEPEREDFSDSGSVGGDSYINGGMSL